MTDGELILRLMRELDLTRRGVPFHKHTSGELCTSPYCAALSEAADPAHILGVENA